MRPILLTAGRAALLSSLNRLVPQAMTIALIRLLWSPRSRSSSTRLMIGIMQPSDLQEPVPEITTRLLPAAHDNAAVVRSDRAEAAA